MISHADGSSGPGQTVDSVETLAALRSIPEVHDAVVTERVGTDGRTMALGYVTGPDPARGTNGIRQHLLSRLPANLVPERVVVLEELPLTPDGDYDLGALPDPPAESAGDAYMAPSTPMERQLADLMTEILRVERVGVHDSFFALGGSSLQATQLTRRIGEMFDVELSLQDVFTSPTVDGQAQLIIRTLGERFGARKIKAQRWRRVLGGLEQAWRSAHGLLPLSLRRWVPPGVPCGGGASDSDTTP